MVLKGLGKAIQGAGVMFLDFLDKEHRIHVSNERLKLFENQIKNSLEDKDIHDIRIRLHDEFINVTGSFKHSGGGTFDIDLIPDGMFWSEYKHLVYFKIVNQSVTLDNKISNFLASSVFKVCEIMLGDQFLNKKMGVVDEDGRIEVCLDQRSSHIDAIVNSIHPSILECVDGKLMIGFSINKQGAIKNREALITWLKSVRN